LLDADHIGRYKLLILPNIAALSDAQCNQLREYVRLGGSLLATHETSLYDEWGKRRTDFGLSDLFGASFVSSQAGPIQNAYLRVEKDPRTGEHGPLLKGLEDAQILIGGTWQLEIKPSFGYANPPLTRIPAIRNLPMEKTFWTVEKTGIPEVVMKETGQSRIVYFPWDIDRLYWEVMAHEHGLLLRNAVEWAANEPPPVKVEGLGMFDVTAWRQKDSMTVHLVNLTNPMAMRPNVNQLIPSHPQTVEVQLPAGKRAGKVQTLMHEAVVPYRMAGDRLKMTVPSVLDYEVVAIDLI
jgi:hypothetical protein